ncbi:MAG TPA: hypothetical protein VIY66_01140 [Candidatus Acidoferrales bacterium]
MKEFLNEPSSIALPRNEAAEPKKTKSAAKPALPGAVQTPSRRFAVSELGPAWRDDRRYWEGDDPFALAESGCAVSALAEMLSRKIRSRTTKSLALCVEGVYV